MTDEFRKANGLRLLDGASVSHGTSVTNLINGSSPVGVGNGKLGAFVVHDPGTDSAAEMAKAAMPIVNISQRRHDSGWSHPSLSSLAKQSILVWATGNSGSHPTMEFSSAPNVIGVGSVGPLGVVSHFSQEGPGTHILAPGENPILSTYDGNHREFGGTSGAAPIVTGALTNVLSVLGELKDVEARRLLEKTAIPTAPSWQSPRRNGAGVLNALKLVQVAIRLKARGWPREREKLLEDASVYDFSRIANGEDDSDILKLLTEGKQALRSGVCARQREGLQKVQSAFLLSAGSPDETSRRVYLESARLMATALEHDGLELNAAFYRGLTPEGLAQLFRSRIPRAETDEVSAIGRALPLLTAASASAVLLPLVQSSEINTALNAVSVASQFNVSDEVLRAAYAHPDARVRRRLIDIGFRGRSGHAILQQATTDPDPGIRALARARLSGERK